MRDIVKEAIVLACTAHEGQRRKYYTNVPYIVHPCRVATRVEAVPGATDVMIAAAWLHDVVEDTTVGPETIEVVCGLDVRTLVGWLTNPSKGSPLPRAQRKAMDRDHLRQAPWEARVIKLIDRTDNLRDMHLAPFNFAKMYHQESVALLEVLHGTDPDLEQEYIIAMAEMMGTALLQERDVTCSVPSAPLSSSTTPTP